MDRKTMPHTVANPPFHTVVPKGTIQAASTQNKTHTSDIPSKPDHVPDPSMPLKQLYHYLVIAAYL